MPVVDVQVVGELPDAANALANALGVALGSGPGHTWVRLTALPEGQYAENDAPSTDADLPVFVTVLLARPPSSAELRTQVRSVTASVAEVLGRDPDRVHVQYAPAAAGRQAFGGRLVE